MKKLILKRIGQTAAAIIFLLAVWLCAYFWVGNELLIPSPAESFKKMGELLTGASFWQRFSNSLFRALEAFALSLIFGAFFAVLSYLLPSVAAFLTPIVSILRSVPAVAALLIIWVLLGAGRAPVAVAVLSLFPMLYTSVLAALKGIDGQIIQAARVQGTPLYRRIFALYLPLTSPYLLREGGGAVAFSLKLILSAEALVGTAASLGGSLVEAKAYGEIPALFALVVLAFLAGLSLELVFNALAAVAEKKTR